MSGVAFPTGYCLSALERTHARKSFDCGEPSVNEWLQARALQNQQKHLSATKVLLSSEGAIAGFYTLATGQVDFRDLPTELASHLPRRLLPVAVLAWLGVDQKFQGQGIGDRLFAQALRDCHTAGQTFAFVDVILDCLHDRAKAFYQRWDFRELPGYPYRLFLSTPTLDAMMKS